MWLSFFKIFVCNTFSITYLVILIVYGSHEECKSAIVSSSISSVGLILTSIFQSLVSYYHYQKEKCLKDMLLNESLLNLNTSDEKINLYLSNINNLPHMYMNRSHNIYYYEQIINKYWKCTIASLTLVFIGSLTGTLVFAECAEIQCQHLFSPIKIETYMSLLFLTILTFIGLYKLCKEIYKCCNFCSSE